MINKYDKVGIKGLLGQWFRGKSGIVEDVITEGRIPSCPYTVLIDNSILVFADSELELWYGDGN